MAKKKNISIDIDPTSLVAVNPKEMKEMKSLGVGLNLMLFNISVKESERINRLSKYIDAVEERIFDINEIDDLTPEEQIVRYQLAVESVNKSTNYINKSLSNIDFETIEAQLALIVNDNVEDDLEKHSDQKQLENVALELLTQLSTSRSSEK